MDTMNDIVQRIIDHERKYGGSRPSDEVANEIASSVAHEVLNLVQITGVTPPPPVPLDQPKLMSILSRGNVAVDDRLMILAAIHAAFHTEQGVQYISEGYGTFVLNRLNQFMKANL